MKIIMKKGKCRSCKAPIYWISTLANQKWMPVNTKEIHLLDSGLRVVTIVTRDGEVVHGNRCLPATPGAIQGYESHFATCPQASQHRR